MASENGQSVGGTDHEHEPVEVPADDGENYRDIDECEGCGSDKAALRAIKMRQGRRRMFCLGCFTHELERSTVDPSDPRVENRGFGGENYV